MKLRVRHVFLAWLSYGVLQLGLLGMPYIPGQLTIGSREACAQSSTQSISATKRLFSSERTERAAHMPFAPAATVVLGFANTAEPRQIVGTPERAAFELATLRPARAPPVFA